MNNNQNTKLALSLKIIGGTILTIFLGAIGSGLWERVLSPALDYVFRIYVNILSSVSTRYIDGIYQSAALGFHEAYSHKLFVILLLLFSSCILLWAALKLSGMLTIHTNFIEFLCEGKLQWLYIILAFSFYIFSFIAINKHDAINSITTYSVRSIDILRPYTGEEEYRKLISEFYQIKTEDDFQKFNKSIQVKAKENNLSLPKFKQI